MWVAMDTVTYVPGLQKGEAHTSIQSFMGRRRSIHDDVNTSTNDVSRLYMWFAAYLWAKEISRDLLRFDFLIFCY
jgi:hypothetical protein